MGHSKVHTTLWNRYEAPPDHPDEDFIRDTIYRAFEFPSDEELLEGRRLLAADGNSKKSNGNGKH